jgi:hypothetical protein
MKPHDHPKRSLRLFSLSSVTSPAERAAAAEAQAAKMAPIFKVAKKRVKKDAAPAKAVAP